MKGSNILVAGQPQSGSTKLFNMVRIALERSGMEVNTFLFSAETGWPDIKDGRVNLAKVHAFDAVAEAGATLVLTTRRDIRDCVVSHVKRLTRAGHGTGPWTPFYYGAWNLECYKAWQRRSDAEFVYEDGYLDPLKQALLLGEVLGLAFSEEDGRALLEQVDNLWRNPLPEFDDKSNDVYQKTLLTESHNTSGGQIGNYKRFDMNWSEFNFVFARFLRECGYEVGNMSKALTSSWQLYALAAVEYEYGQIGPARQSLQQGLDLFEQEYAPFKNFVDLHEKIGGSGRGRRLSSRLKRLVLKGGERGTRSASSHSGASRLLESRRREK